MPRWIEWYRVPGQPIRHGDYEVAPVSGHLRIRLPFAHFVWSRPLAVQVSAPSGNHTIPIRDVTRRAQFGLWTAAAAVALTAWLAGRRSHRTTTLEDSHEG